MQRSRRAVLRSLALTLAGLALGAASGCEVVGKLPRPSSPGGPGPAQASATPQPDQAADAALAEATEPMPAPGSGIAPVTLVPSTPGTLPTVSVPATPTPVPPT